MNKRIVRLLRRCKTLSRQLSLSRSSSYSSLRSKSSRGYHTFNDQHASGSDPEECETIYVGSSRRRYVISSKHLSHPLLGALVRRSSRESGTDSGRDPDPDPDPAVVKCEVVLFDHLLWMLENVDPDMGSDCLDELAELYVY